MSHSASSEKSQKFLWWSAIGAGLSSLLLWLLVLLWFLEFFEVRYSWIWSFYGGKGIVVLPVLVFVAYKITRAALGLCNELKTFSSLDQRKGPPPGPEGGNHQL